MHSDLIVGFLGDATLSDDLKEIEILDTDLFIATTNSDSINALAVQKAKLLFGVDNVICLISDVSKQKLYERLGVKIVNYSEIIIESLIHSSLEN
ncbi:MAG: Trk K+ transport system, NAD-binding component [Chloroflexi bacterium]|nr:MAG: Trk K+ transport system, NAD-binding component [Chloroflexota bacterium]